MVIYVCSKLLIPYKWGKSLSVIWITKIVNKLWFPNFLQKILINNFWVEISCFRCEIQGFLWCYAVDWNLVCYRCIFAGLKWLQQPNFYTSMPMAIPSDLSDILHWIIFFVLCPYKFNLSSIGNVHRKPSGIYSGTYFSDFVPRILDCFGIFVEDRMHLGKLWASSRFLLSFHYLCIR